MPQTQDLKQQKQSTIRLQTSVLRHQISVLKSPSFKSFQRTLHSSRATHGRTSNFKNPSRNSSANSVVKKSPILQILPFDRAQALRRHSFEEATHGPNQLCVLLTRHSPFGRRRLASLAVSKPSSSKPCIARERRTGQSCKHVPNVAHTPYVS
jgi:hypothetical protein